MGDNSRSNDLPNPHPHQESLFEGDHGDQTPVFGSDGLGEDSDYQDSVNDDYDYQDIDYNGDNDTDTDMSVKQEEHSMRVTGSSDNNRNNRNRKQDNSNNNHANLGEYFLNGKCLYCFLSFL